MNLSDFQAFDLRRIFLGDLPWLFLLEVAFRTVFMYVYALVMIRFLGKRGIGNLSPFDFVIIIALGSATGDPMFYEDVPLGYAMVVLAMIVCLPFSEKEVRRGLPLYPPLQDEDPILTAGDYIAVEEDDHACCGCGRVVDLDKKFPLPRCATCSGSQWRVALPPANPHEKTDIE